MRRVLLSRDKYFFIIVLDLAVQLSDTEFLHVVLVASFSYYISIFSGSKGNCHFSIDLLT